MSKKYFLLSTLLAIFSMAESTYANKSNITKSSVLGENSVKTNSLSHNKVDPKMVVLSLLLGSTAAYFAVQNESNKKQIKKLDRDFDYEHRLFLKKCGENAELEKKINKFDARETVLQEECKCYHGQEKIEFLKDIICYSNLGFDFGSYFNKKDNNHYFEQAGDGFPLLNLFSKFKEKYNGSHEILKKIVNGENVLENFYFLPQKSQRYFIEASVKNMAAIEAVNALSIENYYGLEEEQKEKFKQDSKYCNELIKKNWD